MSGMMQIVGFASAGAIAAGVGILLTRAGFQLVARRSPPRLVDRLAAVVLGLLAFAPLFIAAQTVASVDSFQEHRTDSILAFVVFWLVPLGWYVFRRRPPR